MKILLTHTYFIEEDLSEQKIMRPYPPLGILYLSAFLKNCNFEHQVLDTTFSNRTHFLNSISSYKPNIIAIYCNLITKPITIQMIQTLKTFPELQKTTFILGGPDVSYNAENYLKFGGDIIVIGEGENTFIELCLALKDGKNIHDISGIAFLKDNIFTKNPPREKIKNIENLPIPNRDAIDINLYLDAWKNRHGISSLNISTQRGCPYSCNWCSTAVYGQSYRRRPAKNVVDEIENIQKKYNPDKIWFVDDVFTVSHIWIQEFADEILKRNISVSFECITRAERLNNDILDLLVAIGCFRIWIGAESGSQDVIELMNRKVNVEQVKNIIKLTKSKGIEAGTFIMLGYPGETYQDVLKTIEYIHDVNPTHFTSTLAYAITGTTLHSQIKNKLPNFPWQLLTDRQIPIPRKYSMKFYNIAFKLMQTVLYKTKQINTSLNLLKIFKVSLKIYTLRILLFIFSKNVSKI